MPLRNLLQDIVIATTVLFTGFYACYAGLCYWYLKRKNRTSAAPLTPQDPPKVTIIVPTYNEESVVTRRIENFNALNYPQDKLQVIFVDGSSTDSTVEMIERMNGDGINLVLLQQTQREGYNRAIMDGFSIASGSIISITGAETEFDSNALLQMVKHFSRADVGAVTGRMITRNQEVFSGKVEKAYRDLYDFMRQGETLIDSCFDVKGELNAARREIVERILQKPNIATKGSADTCMAFQSRIMGMKTVFEPEAVYWEDAPSIMRESFQQTIRRGHVHMEAMSLYKDMYFNRRLGIFGLLIAPAHLAMIVLLPLVFGLALFSLALLFLIDPHNPLAIILIPLALVTLVLSRHAHAFAKIQLSLIGAIVHSLLGWKPFGMGHTRLPSTRLSQETTKIEK